MNGHVRIRSQATNLKHLLRRWQVRHQCSGAVHFADPSTLLIGTDTSVDALEDLLRALSAHEAEVVWRPRVPTAAPLLPAPTEA